VNTEALIKEQHDPDSKPVLTRLKWFNATKGFGFAVPEEDPCDAFIHITTLQDAGIHELGENALVTCHVVKGPKGALVTKVDKLIETGTDPVPITFRIEIADDEVLEKMTGIVKWYKPDKGFGFIIPEDGQKDVFVHKSCLDRLKIELLIPGQQVKMTVRTVAKGREVIKFSLLNAQGDIIGEPEAEPEDLQE
jgi:CspA family cold shock protein